VERKVAETHKWMFIRDIPLLYETRNVARQLEVEMWLDPSPFFDALNLKPVRQGKPNEPKYLA